MTLAPDTKIDWSNPDAEISDSFTVHDACWLPSWNIIHNPDDVDKYNIVLTAYLMEQIVTKFNKKPRIHCWIRPVLNNPKSSKNGQDYNAFVKGASKSAHRVGKAVDFDIPGLSCDAVRAKLLPVIKDFGFRMEDRPGSTWIHLDIEEPAGLYFKA